MYLQWITSKEILITKDTMNHKIIKYDSRPGVCIAMDVLCPMSVDKYLYFDDCLIRR